MKKIAVERFVTYFGKECEDIGECAVEELEESLERAVKKHGYNGMGRDKIADMLCEYADEFRAILGGDFSSVMTEEEKANDPMKNANVSLSSGPTGLLFDLKPHYLASLPLPKAVESIAKTIQYCLEYYVDNPSAWPTPGGFNQAVSDRIREIVEYSRYIESIASKKGNGLS